MIDTLHLIPPACGPCSNPVLHGIAEAIAVLIPLRAEPCEPCDEAKTASPQTSADDVQDEAGAAA